MFCQPGDGERLAGAGFSATQLGNTAHFRGVDITPVTATHGSGPVLERMGSVIGLVFSSPDEPTLYWSGDTVMTDAVRGTIVDVHPDVIVCHSGGATAGGTTIIMDIADTLEVARLAPSATVVAVHLEAVAHAPVTRAGLRAAAETAGIDASQLRIPADGEVIALHRS